MITISLLCTIWVSIALADDYYLDYYGDGEGRDCEENWPMCGNYDNIVCTNKGNCERILNTCSYITATEDFRRIMLEEHNALRNQLALGNEPRGGNGPAADMMILSYDVSLEFTARCHVLWCNSTPDHCRATPKMLSTGQNIWQGTDLNIIDDAKVLRDAIVSWYEEVSFCEEANIDSFNEVVESSGKKIGHFTQMVWSSITRVGCARSISTAGEKWNTITCNYGLGGNAKGSPVYKRGTACSKCPKGVSCNKNLTGLCGEIEELPLYSPELTYRSSSHRARTYFEGVLNFVFRIVWVVMMRGY